MTSTMENPTPPRAAACPDCGQLLALPRLTPEALYFLSYGRTAPQIAVLLPGSDDVVFAFDGLAQVMRVDEWQHYEAMRDAA
ncbi:hypothetical protein [Prosthecobacter sp.]|uniref:hypothetical protein n=1 Tax=Prosthecobacter sp. TaxID=1965333 RepID=UPI0037839FD7